jgi:ubiquinone/menaquinone biosynthesis C-methylase UbiE
MTNMAWVDLQSSNFRNMLISLIGYRFGPKPEERLDEIRTERSLYAEGFLQLAGIKPGDSVLEIGSGCGFGTAAIARRAREVVACDISPAFLEYARQECADFDNVRFLQVNSRDLSALGDQSVNAVVAISVFIHLNLYDMYLYFKEFHRILRPKGTVVFDFADMNRLFGGLRAYGNNDLFLEHAEYYRADPSALPALIQWNSARGITGIARAAGFKRLKRRGHKVLFGL